MLNVSVSGKNNTFAMSRVYKEGYFALFFQKRAKYPRHLVCFSQKRLRNTRISLVFLKND